MINKIFISHARKDNEIAKQLAENLKNKGINAWLDEFELKPGESWEQQIKNALLDSDAVVLVIGDGKVTPNVLVEAGMALSQGKRILPFMVGDNINKNHIFDLQHFQPLNAKGVEAAADQIASMVTR